MSTEAAQIVDQIQSQPTPETLAPPTPAQVVNPPQDKISSKIDILLKREQAAVLREKAAKQREAELEQKLSRYNDFESVKTNPKKALELLGLSYDDLTRSMLSEGEVPPDVQIKKLMEEIESLKSGITQDKDQAQLEKQRQLEAQEKQAVDSFKNDINSFIKTNTARYELIEFENAHDLIYEVINEHYDRTLKADIQRLTELGEDSGAAVGKIMSINEAADKVELYLEQKYEKSRGLNKVKAFWESMPKQMQKQAIQEAATKNIPSGQQTQQQKTLTNQLAAQQGAPKRQGPISDDERIRRAIAYAKSLRPNL